MNFICDGRDEVNSQARDPKKCSAQEIWNVVTIGQSSQTFSGPKTDLTDELEFNVEKVLHRLTHQFL